MAFGCAVTAIRKLKAIKSSSGQTPDH